MSERDYNQEFSDIVAQLGITTSLSTVDINSCVVKLSEAAMFLSGFLVAHAGDPDLEFPDELVTVLPAIKKMSHEVVRCLDELIEPCDCDDDCELETKDWEDPDQWI